MKIYCIGGKVAATHRDDQDVPATAYGAGCTIMVVPDTAALTAGDDAPSLAGGIVDATIKAACSRRINAVLKDRTTQINMVGAAVALARKEAAETITEGEAGTLALLQAGQDWVRSMQEASRDLIADEGTGWEDDASWPPAPSGLADLSDGF